MDQYFGTYQTFETPSKKEAGALLGADNLVGDAYEIEIELDNGVHVAWLKNRFNKRIGFFNPEFSRKLSVYRAKGFTLVAILSFIAYTDSPDPGRYWGEMAVIGFDSAYADAFNPFTHYVMKRMEDNVRTAVDLGEEAVQHIISSNGSWLPDKTVSMPAREKGTVIMKDKRSINDKLVELGRAKNVGCYVASWAFIIALVVLVVFGLKSCGVF